MRAKDKIKLYIITLAALSLITTNSAIAQESDIAGVNKVDVSETTIIETKEDTSINDKYPEEEDKQLAPLKETSDNEVEIEPIEDNEQVEAEFEELTPDGDNKTNEKPLSARAVVVDLISDKLEYFQDTDSFVATGKAKVLVTEQDAELVAEKIIYYQGEQYITAEGNVKITKEGRTITGNFARVDLDKESALITNPHSVISKVRMKAKEANLYPEYIELNEGEAVVSQDNIDLSLTAGEYKPRELGDKIPGKGEDAPPDPDKKKAHFKITAKEIELDRAKTVNNLIIKNASVYVGKIKVARIPRLTLTIGENAQSVEAMMPEVGFDKTIGGVYIGPSLTLDLPKNSMLRISPVFSAAGRDHAVGGGGIVRFRSGINKTDFAYTSTGNRIVLDGEQKLYKDTTKIKYSINQYPDDGFLGTGFYRPLYLFELVDERKIGKVLNHNIFSRGSAAIARDVDDGIATARFQLQGNIVSDKPILHYKDNVEFRLQSQFNLAYYGTGHKYAIVRGGPRVDWKAWRLNLTTAYMQAGVWGSTPFVFDEFIRGKSNLILAGDFKLCKFLSVGNIRSLNLGKDGAEPRLSTENQFYARVGPEDFKFRVGYDLARKRSTFGIDLFLGSGRSALKFDKMKILNPGTNLNY